MLILLHLLAILFIVITILKRKVKVIPNQTAAATAVVTVSTMLSKNEPVINI